MKKFVCVCVIFFLFLLVPVWAEKNDVNLGFGIEGNMNTNKGWAFGRSISVDIQLFKYVIMGTTLTISDDFKQFTAIEPAFFVRWHPPLTAFPFLKKAVFLDVKDGVFFVQGDIGISVVIGFFDRNVAPMFLGGLTLGFRFPFQNGDYFVEPFIKSGYPFLFGAGMRFGCRF
jgi:hypothetical protein